MKYLSLFCITLILFSRCNNVSSFQNSQKLSSDTLLYREIFFPSDMSVMEGYGFHKTDSLNHLKQNKIISIIDATCVKCIYDQLNKMDSIFQTINHTKNSLVIFILNVPASDSAYFILNIRPSIKAKGIILLDNRYAFEGRNNLFTTEASLRTFLTNNENKIILYGNPIANPALIPLYRNRMAE